jgi:excisionase family DNA binding protein
MSKLLPNPDALPHDGVATKEMVSNYFGVTPRTIEKWVAQGLIQKLNLPGRVVRFSVSDVRQLGS